MLHMLLAVVAVGAVRDSDMQLDSSGSDNYWKHHHHHHHHHHHNHQEKRDAWDEDKGTDQTDLSPPALMQPAYPRRDPFPVGSLLNAHTVQKQHRARQQKAEVATGDEACQEEVDVHQPQHLLEALRRCLEARKELSVKTQELLKEEKEGGKEYATEVTDIMNLIKKVQDADRMDLPWKQDHTQVLQQLLEQTGEAEKEAEAVWQDHPTGSHATTA
ncbi:unnamed protein product [Symbiodinium natans]|uniref:Uncharacterized protein n=1 Tax=Symbiodinium natans TaxID=878477 RepID=A0A812RLW2_9DINO|nr:unnamed protein product [Symbiodinium natans]